jgi:uncharacterized membrane protein
MHTPEEWLMMSERFSVAWRNCRDYLILLLIAALLLAWTAFLGYLAWRYIPYARPHRSG